ncbi:DUF2933 domain-containing protein [Neobacillus sp. PS3-40]|uniref:DUF2933 domain-containing protein n=1 Tax=Neobacillus sp. PS3-40 TaxID=3070679 RepID=UPI0027DFD6DC|nr:DUF2933 domain-containing protein [Neobacillus sp. PS3-40]WML43416.1 DUF2933 domain-containing protein [Neobacillus sp. PS3-40]
MQWLSYLLILICPLMMIFMMKGHGGGHHNHDKSHASHDLNRKVDLLQEENIKLRNEIETLSSLMKKDS